MNKVLQSSRRNEPANEKQKRGWCSINTFSFLKTHATEMKHLVSSAGLITMREEHFKTYILLMGVHTRDSQFAITSAA